MSFRYPVGDGTREDFEKKWYVALAFGAKQDYGFHEGIDINLKTGGDTDNGEPLYAISDWDLTNYHLKTHLEAGFGCHLVTKVETPWGTRWIHYAHAMNPLNPSAKSKGSAGDKLAELDKTGRPRFILPAHLHFSVFKVDPSTLRNGIDTIAKTKAELDSWWEDPLAFLHKWNDNKDPIMDIKQLIIDIRLGLLGDGPSNDEVAYDLGHWENPKSFIERITGDSKFYAKYIQPQLDNQKQRLESDCSTQLLTLTQDYQSQLATAKKESDEKIALLEKQKAEDLDVVTLLSLALKKLIKKQ